MLRHLKLKIEIKMKIIDWCIEGDIFLEKYKAILTKIENIKNIELNA